MPKSKTKEGEFIPAKLGRPQTFKPEFCERWVAMVDEEGKSISTACKELGISRQTYYRWKSAHPEFKEAADYATTCSEAYWEQIGEAAILGKIKGFQPSVYIHKMKSRYGWDDKGEHAENSIHIENLQINKFDKLSNDDLEKQIAQIETNLKRLKLSDSEDPETNDE